MVINQRFYPSIHLHQVLTVSVSTFHFRFPFPIEMNARVKPLNNNHLLKATSVQTPPLYKDHIAIMAKVYLIATF